jgi:hypothetical protein
MTCWEPSTRPSETEPRAGRVRACLRQGSVATEVLYQYAERRLQQEVDVTVGRCRFRVLRLGVSDYCSGFRFRVDPMQSALKAPGCMLLKLRCHGPLSHCVFNCNLRRYITVVHERLDESLRFSSSALGIHMVKRCTLSSC